MGMCEDAGAGDDWYVSVLLTSCPGCHSRTFIAKETAGTIGITNHQLLENETKLEVLCFSVLFGQRKSKENKEEQPCFLGANTTLSTWKATMPRVPLAMPSSPVTHLQLELPDCLP